MTTLATGDSTAEQPTALGPLARGQFDAPFFGITAQALEAVIERCSSPESYQPAELWAPTCVDGRLDENGARWPGACVAGGILTPVFGFVAANGLQPSETIIDIMRKLAKRGFKPVTHEDCGALNLFMQVMPQLAQGDTTVEQVLALLDVPAHPGEVRAAAAAIPHNFMVPFQDLSETIADLGGITERTRSEHREVATVINTQTGKTFDRRSLQGIAGEPSVFSLDVWAMQNFATKVGADRPAVALAAMASLNAAVLLKLAGPQQRLVFVP